MLKNLKIYVAGHRGMVGSAIVRQLREKGFHNLVLRTHQQVDLVNQTAVREFFQSEQPDQVYLAAAKVGGIYANDIYPAEFIYQNLMIESNVIHEAWRAGVKKLLFLGSSCIYPKMASQPMAEDALLTGTLESTNEPYAIAKIAGIKLCESYNRQYGTDYRSVMPTNLYGLGDNYHSENSHVIPALIRRFHEAKVAMESNSALSTQHSELNAHCVNIWGTGAPRREFLNVDDMATASVHVMNLDKDIYDANTQPMLNHINVGVGDDITIKELAETIAEVIGYKGNIEYDRTKPDGTPRKLMDSTRLHNLGWEPKIGLKEGLRMAYADFKKSAYAILSNEC
ncbi:GDP-L-fucose synthase [Prosthecochloris sp. SCSIO W1103]|uniref:GDP-L-fucose synthase n=1 Tax=Prosthecochloris sp. SCSIO W1103 TaxID=2992244 RepID=UPI00223CEB53|nr:GDP-L-fucose synthase [Prosthecochloris sp. SCSIO W1103]UZJ38139.1 GDP-L-fucose synthase [Prosthecochloris sp. SCSIO W1103]